MSVFRAEQRSRLLVLVITAAILAAAAAGGAWYSNARGRNMVVEDKTALTKPKDEAIAGEKTDAAEGGLSLSTSKNYGDKYSSGLLPVGDGKYVTDGPKTGYVYECQANFVPASQAGAQVRGPWFTSGNTMWDINKKARIRGSVTWSPSLNVSVSGGKRTITTNGLPSHVTGVFPVSSSDPARSYDANPNAISSQSLTYVLDAAPVYSAKPSCMGGEAGVMLTGSALFNAFDAGGRDAGAWEVQDGCGGHPQNKGEYHYHSLSSCINDIGATVIIGYALDGFPITGPKVAPGSILTTTDLDECHGLSGPMKKDGAAVTGYHYVMTQDFPYSVSCFRGTPVQPPGQKESQAGQPPPGNKLPPKPAR